MVEEIEEKTIRRYLLGELPEAEMLPFEERLMTDDPLFEMLLVIEDELIDESVAGELSAEEQARFEAYFLATPRRRERLELARALHDYEYAARRAADRPNPAENPASGAINKPASVTRSENTSERVEEDFSSPAKILRPARWLSPSQYVILAAAASILIAVGLDVWRTIFPSEVSKGLQALNTASRKRRRTEARLTGFDYAPLSATRGNDSGKGDTLELDLAGSLLLAAVKAHPDAPSLRAAGLFYLVKRDVDQAIEYFNQAVALEANNPQLQSDLGAALLEKGKLEREKGEAGKSFESLAQSLEHLTRALELNDSLLEALFNRALCRQYMNNLQQAQEDWQKYLEKDDASKWADEARRNLQTIEEQRSKGSQDKESLFDVFLSAYRAGDDDRAWDAFSRCHIRAGNLITERLIDNYLELITKQPHEPANDLLKALVYAGELQYRKVADRFTLDLAEFYKASAFRNQSELITARTSVKLAQQQIAQTHMPQALETYSQAKRSFDRIGDRGEARFAEYWVGICSSQISPRQGVATFQQLIQACERDNYKSLAIRSLNGLANSYLGLNAYSKAISYSGPSLSLAQQTQDSYGCVLALSHLISAYKPLGNFDQCLNYLQPFLDLAIKHALEPAQACLCYAQTAWVLSSCDLNAAALDYQKTALEMALQLKELTMICTAYVHLAMIEARLKHYSEALMNAQQALAVANEWSTEPAGLKMKAYALLHLGSLYRQTGNLDKAIASYNQSIELYKQIDFPAFLYLARKGLFASLADAGNVLLAKAELDETISYYESQRGKITEQNNRESFFDLEQDIYDLAMDFESVRLNDAQAAFEYSELSRGRSLLDALYQGSQVRNGAYGPEEVFSIASPPLNLAAIQHRLPEGVQILQYAVLEDKLTVWLITKNSFKQLNKEIALKELSKQVQNCLQLVQDPTSGHDLWRISRELYDVLIGPAEPWLDKNKSLFIIPDKILSFLPFDCLISSSNKYLIEEYPVASSPSSSVLIICSDLAREKGRIDEESVLSVGITHFASRQDDMLGDLPSAAKEASAIASLYKGSPPLVEERATKSAVMDEILSANVIQFASHFVRDPFSPMRSRLLLAMENQNTANGLPVNGDLASFEICRLKLPAARLAVLSACQTGVERYYRGEGTTSIARAFITAGVPLVVASLWPVDSDATAELMIRFHRGRKHDGLSSIEALRQAQRSMLDEPKNPYRHPYYWAAFNLIGGYANY
jgi:CHAT domain-containing protein/exonuclease VII small subunit